MPHIQADSGGSSAIVYPVEHMRTVAAQILATASLAQSNHDAQWQQVLNYINNNFDPTMHATLLACLKPYADQVRESYDWQISLATALFDTVNQIDRNEQGTQQSLGFTHGPAQS